MGSISFTFVCLNAFGIIVLVLAEAPFDHCTCRRNIFKCRRQFSNIYRYRTERNNAQQDDSYRTTQKSQTTNGIPYIDVKVLCPLATEVQLGNLELREFPDGLEGNITKVEASSNLLTALPNSTQLSSNIKYLDLSANEIVIANEQLRSLAMLEELRLGWNRLRHLRFLPTPCALRRLDLTVNFITSLDGASLGRCGQLESFRILANNVTELPDGVFVGLDQLQYLTLSKNPIESLSNRSFDGLSQLKTLNLDDALLTTLPPNAFAALQHLQELEISGNPFESLPEGSFDGLTELKTLRLTKALRNVTELPENLFSELRNLRVLYLDKNNLTYIPDNFFQQLNHLEELHLESNVLNYISENAFASLGNLKTLRLDRNAITEVPSGLFSKLRSLNELQMPFNRLTALPDLSGCTSLSTANFYRNLVATPSEARIRALLDDGEQRYVSLEGNPIRASSLHWVLRAEDINTFAQSCECGGLRKGNAAVHFCVVVPCGPPSAFSSWMMAVAAANDGGHGAP